VPSISGRRFLHPQRRDAPWRPRADSKHTTACSTQDNTHYLLTMTRVPVSCIAIWKDLPQAFLLALSIIKCFRFPFSSNTWCLQKCRSILSFSSSVSFNGISRYRVFRKVLIIGFCNYDVRLECNMTYVKNASLFGLWKCVTWLLINFLLL
jgi:hypothetical protein